MAVNTIKSPENKRKKRYTPRDEGAKALVGGYLSNLTMINLWNTTSEQKEKHPSQEKRSKVH